MHSSVQNRLDLAPGFIRKAVVNNRDVFEKILSNHFSLTQVKLFVTSGVAGTAASSKEMLGSSCRGSVVTNLISMRTWVRSLALLSQIRIWCCWKLWCRPAAAAPVHLLTQEPPYAAGAALKQTNKQKKCLSGVLLQHSGLRIWHCHCSSLGHCHGLGSIPGPGTPTHCGNGKKEKCLSVGAMSNPPPPVWCWYSPIMLVSLGLGHSPQPFCSLKAPGPPLRDLSLYYTSPDRRGRNGSVDRIPPLPPTPSHSLSTSLRFPFIQRLITTKPTASSASRINWDKHQRLGTVPSPTVKPQCMTAGTIIV